MAYLQRGYWHVNNQNGTVRAGGPVHYPLHRLLYEEAHGVVLGKEWIIHHINGDPLDNRIENLEALLRSEHPSRHRRAFRGDERHCARCGLWKTIEAFPKKGYCYDCKREFGREWLKANRETVSERRRARYAAMHPNARKLLTNDQVRSIRRDPRPAREVAAEYGVSRWRIYDVRTGKTWKDVM